MRTQYSSPEPEYSLAGRESHDRSRSRKAASAGESRKSKIDLLQRHGPQLGRCQRAAQVDVYQTLPGIADAAVHLHGGLADGSGGTRAVDLRDLGGPNGFGRREFVDPPC